jgi:hypothetical protein
MRFMSVHDGPGTDGKEIQVKAAWPEDLGADVQVANQIAISSEIPTMHGKFDGGVYLTLGHLRQPLIQDPAQLAQLAQSETPLEVPIRSLGSFYLSTERARDLVSVLTKHLDGLPGGEGSQ